jgi:hypothetical protein
MAAFCRKPLRRIRNPNSALERLFSGVHFGMDMWATPLAKNPILRDNQNMSAQKTLHEIESEIGTLSLPERLRLYKDMPQLIGRSAEDLDWQRLGIENFFQDDSPDDQVYDSI